MNIDNLILRAPVRYSNTPAASDAEWSYERAKFVRRLESEDLFELVGDSLVTAVKTGDEALVGRVLMATVNTYLNRLADRACGMEPRQEPEDAAAEALQADLTPLLRASIERLS